jgi:hypothetical protein
MNNQVHLIKSRTGMIHVGWNRVTECNGRATIGARNISAEEASYAREEAFCKKCMGQTPRKSLAIMIERDRVADA